MNNHGLATLLEEFSAQRRYREQKRKEFLRRFEQLKAGFGGNTQPRAHTQQQESRTIVRQVRESIPEHQQPQEKLVNHVRPAESEPAANPEEEALLKENKQLKQTYGQLESSITEEMKKFQATVNETKDVYVGQIAKIVEGSNKSKAEMEKKMKKLKEQTEAALVKNKEIETVNNQIQKQLDNLNEAGPNFEQIRKQYDDKLTSFQAIFASSNEKIEALEKEFNEEEFIQTTMKNQDLLKNIEENAEKAAEAAKILQDYRSLCEGKKEILTEIQNNNEMKEKQISKMCQLEEKMKVIMEKLGKEKQAMVSENNRMAKELMEIKELLMQTVGQGK